MIQDFAYLKMLQKLMLNNMFPNIRQENNQKGFVATITVTVLAFSIVAMLIVVSGAVDRYVDSVYLYELRIYTRQSLLVCMPIAENMLASDYFLRGVVSLPEYNCDVSIQDYTSQTYQVAHYGNIGQVILSVVTKFGPVEMKVYETIRLYDYRMEDIDRIVDD